MYDVIVIGAGPAGCTAAKILAENGYQVLLAEKFKMPRYKSCSGQLIQKSIRLVEAYFGASVPHFVTCAPAENKGMIFVNDKGDAFRFEQSGLNVWRSSFDNWLAEKAVQSGAEVRDNTSVLSCSENNGIVSVKLKDSCVYEEQAKYVLVCEGAAGILKQKLLNKSQPHIITYQTFNCGQIDLDYHYFYAYLQPEFSEYDAWFNVKDNQMVLGVSVKDKNKIADFYASFLAYMRENYNLKIEKQLKTDKWLMSHIQPGCPIDYGVGRVLFGGECAGFLNPMGEGISCGLESGYCAANAMIHNFQDLEAVYADYKAKTAALHDYMKRQWNFVARMTDTFKEMKI